MKYSLLFAVSITVIFNAQCTRTRPQIQFVNKNLDLGAIDAGHIAATAFVFSNKGTGTLIIKNIEVECGCTKTFLADSIIEAGEKDSILVTFESNKLTDWGTLKREIRIRSNSQPEEESLTFVVHVNNDSLVQALKGFKDSK